MRALPLLLLACAPARPGHTEVVRDPPVMIRWCVDETSCGPGLKYCLDICYKYNHPDGPKHGACDRTCRRNHCGRKECS